MNTGLRKGVAAAIVSIALAGAAPARADGITDGNQGRQALIAGRLDEAIALFTHALDFGALTVRNQAVTRSLRGYALLQKGQNDAALNDLNESLRLAETPDAYFTRAKIFIAQLGFDDAAQDLTRALALGGNAADLYALRGYAQLYAGRLKAALQDEDQSIGLTRDYGFAYRTRGHAFIDQGQDDKAIADETRAIALDPMDIEAHWLRAYVYRSRRKDLAKAVADYDAALAIDPEDPNARASRGETFEQMGRYAQAAADYDALVRLNPQGASGYLARGRLSLIQGRPAAAAVDFAQSVSLNPTDGQGVLLLHLARAKLSAEDAVEIQTNAALVAREAWPGPLLSHVLGLTDAAAVLAKASASQGQGRVEQLCQADLFLSEDDLAKGRRAEGLKRLEAAAGVCDPASGEARLALADLKRLGVAAPRPQPADRAQYGRSLALRGPLY